MVVFIGMYPPALAGIEARIPGARHAKGSGRTESGRALAQPKNAKSSVLLNGNRCAPGESSTPRYRRSALCTCLG